MTGEGKATLIELPLLGPGEALRLVYLLDRLQCAIWAAHGQEMSELLLERHIDGQEIDESQLDLFDGDSNLPF